MCELFALSSDKRISVKKELEEFFSHAKDNPDGWGLAKFESGIEIVKEEKCALESESLKKILEEDCFEEKVMMAHIRKASIGSVCIENCHPFVSSDSFGRKWVLIHNGTIYSASCLEIYKDTQKGTTDSERILLGLVDFVSAAGNLGSEERFSVVSSYIKAITPKNKANLVFYDGELLYYHTNLKGTLYRRIEDGSILISTKPLTIGDWQSVPLNTLIASKDGRDIFIAKSHFNEFTA